jgi:hypothetical protein
MLAYCIHCKEYSVSKKRWKRKDGSVIWYDYCINKGCKGRIDYFGLAKHIVGGSKL